MAKKNYMNPEQIASLVAKQGYDSAEVRLRPSFFGRKLYVEVVSNGSKFQAGEFPRYMPAGGGDLNYADYESAKARLLKLAKDLNTALKKNGVTIKKNDQLESLLDSEAPLEGTKVRLPLALSSLIGVLGGLFFLSANITGNVIANMASSTSNTLGVALVLVGLVSGFFYVRRR